MLGGQLPLGGGAVMAAAYDNPPDEIKARIESLTAIHDADRHAHGFHPAYPPETARWTAVNAEQSRLHQSTY